MIDENEYDLVSIRRLLAAAFSATDLPLLIFELFPRLYDDLGSVSFTEKTLRIVHYAEKQGDIPRLLTYIRKNNPRQYKLYASQLMKTDTQLSPYALSRGEVAAEIEKIRHAFIQVDCRDANEIWQNLLTEETVVPIADLERQRIETILRLAEGEWLKQEDVSWARDFIKRTSKKWFPALAGAILCAYEKFLPADYPSLSSDVVRFFPFERLTDDYLRRKLWLLDQELRFLSLQDWQPIIRWPGDSPSDKQAGLPAPLREQDPLAHRKAEAEQSSLYERDAYWRKRYDDTQALHQWLTTVPTNCVIYGEPGCGRTALALAMVDVQTEQGQNNFVVYQAGLPTVTAIQQRLATQLLRYICYKPTLLRWYHEATYSICAQLLVQILGRHQVATALVDSQRDKPWLTGATDAQKKEWPKVGVGQIDLLLQMIDGLGYDPGYPDLDVWLKNLLHCFQALGFHGVKLVLDGTINISDSLESWLQSPLFAAKHLGFTVALFVPVDHTTLTRDALRQLISRQDVWSMELTWRVAELEALLAYRFLYVAGIEDPEICFDFPGTYCQFIEGATFVPEIENVDTKKLQEWLVKHFSLNELRELCFALDVDDEILSGTNKVDKSLELISYLKRRSRIIELEREIIRLRPRLAQQQGVVSASPQRLVEFWQLCRAEMTKDDTRITASIVERAEARFIR